MVNAVGGNECHLGEACVAQWVAAQGNLHNEQIALGMQLIGGKTEECGEIF